VRWRISSREPSFCKEREEEIESRELGGETRVERSRERAETCYSPAFVNICIDIWKLIQRAVFPAHELSVYVYAFECHLYVVDTGYR
jgi:hypothetical protein